jgi:hypothetical protein
MFFSLSLVFTSTKLENKKAEQVLPGSGGGEKVYTHVIKCKNDEIKKKRN